MAKYWIFLKYLIRHKWHVFVECCRQGVPWRGMSHDVSKFLPSEFIAYTNYYYENHISSQRTDIPIDQENSPYYLAWLIHQKRNRHHWQWWILHGEENHPRAIPMPEQYIKEMVADWYGAGRAQGQPDTLAWYERNKERMILHTSTRIRVEQLLYAGQSAADEIIHRPSQLGRSCNRRLRHSRGFEANYPGGHSRD